VLRVRDGKASNVLRMTVAALLLFSCARVIQPLASQTTGSSAEVAVRCAQVARCIVFEVGGAGAKLVHPIALRFREALVSFAPTLSVFQFNQRPQFVQVWPEHRQSFFRRILPSASDAAH
jgi:hypothetical protein